MVPNNQPSGVGLIYSVRQYKLCQ